MRNVYYKLRKTFLAATIPAVVLIGAAETLYFGFQFSVVVIALTGGLLIGFCIFLLAKIFFHLDRKAWWITTICMVTTTILGVIISTIVSTLASFYPHQEWLETIPAPEAIEEFLPVLNSQIRFRAKSGTIYIHDCRYFETPGKEPCAWLQESSSWLQDEYKQFQELEEITYSLPFFPGRTVEAYESYYLFPDSVLIIKFIRLEDGRLFILHQMRNPLEIIMRIVCGALIGLIVSISANIAIFLSLRQNTTVNSEDSRSLP